LWAFPWTINGFLEISFSLFVLISISSFNNQDSNSSNVDI
jgi:hypothetical protein